MSRRDYAGLRFGQLTAIEPTKKRGGSTGCSVFWKLRCDCGEVVERIPGIVNLSIKKGFTPSCGCTRQDAQTIDLVGHRYGRLTVLSQTGRGRQGTRWRCACDCGNETVARSKDLRIGTTTSCGCAQRSSAGAHRDLMPGDRYGNLVALYDTGERRASQKVFLCQCDCGRQTRVRKPLLLSGQTKSCGCLRQGARRRLAHSAVIDTLCDVGRIIA